MERFILYGTSACHLCELAEAMIGETGQVGVEFELEKVDISASDTLFERYGVVIPVLQHPDGSELRWPFTAGQLERFLAGP